MESETWELIPGHPGYEVSNLGRVQSADLYDRGGRLAKESFIVKQSINRGPSGYRYWEVSLRRVGCNGHEVRDRRKVHHLVCEAFHGPRPDGFKACHNDGDKNNNRADNLRWDTQANNIADMHRHRGGHHNALKTECKYGHDLTDPTNLYKNGTGRKCRTCAILHSKAQYAARKAQAL